MVDTSRPDFKEILDQACKEADISDEDLKKQLPLIKLLVVLTWPLGILENLIRGGKD